MFECVNTIQQCVYCQPGDGIDSAAAKEHKQSVVLKHAHLLSRLNDMFPTGRLKFSMNINSVVSTAIDQ